MPAGSTPSDDGGAARPGRARRSTSIRKSLARTLVALVVVTAAAVLLVTSLGRAEAVEDLTRSLIDRTAARTEVELKRFFEPVRADLRVARSWGRAGVLHEAETETLNKLFMPLLEETGQIESMMIAHSGGLERLLLDQGETWLTRVIDLERWGRLAYWRTWKSPAEAVDVKWQLVEPYDPRDSAWFKGAMALDGEDVFWSEAYTLFNTKEPGITAAVRWKVTGSDRDWVIAFDVPLTDISRFTQGLKVSDNGTVAVLAGEDRVLGLPRGAEAGGSWGAELPPAGDIGAPELADAVARWRADGGEAGAFAFDSGGEAWWAEVRPFTVGPERTLWIVALVPERDFLGDVQTQQLLILGIALAALLAAVLLAIWLARAFSRPLESLAAQSARIRELDLREAGAVPSRLQEVRELADAQAQMLSALQSFSRYVPTEVVRQLVARGEVAQIGGRTAELTVLFTDIEGFTGIAEGMTPEELAAHMAEYFEAVLEIVREEGGTVDKLVGDAVVAFWGAPSPVERHARRAVQAVVRATRRLRELGDAWEAVGRPRLRTRFGLDTGDVVVGNIGAPTRLAYTVLGDTVNQASRLEGLNRVYGTSALATSAVKAAAGEGFVWRQVDRVAVKGKRRAVDVYELLGAEGEVDPARAEFATMYDTAFGFYQARRFEDALRELDGVPVGYREDPSVLRLAGICRQLAASPPPMDWDGVQRLAVK